MWCGSDTTYEQFIIPVTTSLFWRTTLQLVFTVRTWICYIRVFNFNVLISLVIVTVVSNMYVVLSICGAYLDSMRIGVYWGCCVWCTEGKLGCVSFVCRGGEGCSCYLRKYWYNRYISNIWLWQSVWNLLMRLFLLQVQKKIFCLSKHFPFQAILLLSLSFIGYTSMSSTNLWYVSSTSNN